MKRLIEILLISTLLFTLAFFAGCKDEAEANEPNEIIVLKGMRHAWQEEGWNRIDYEPKPEPNEPEISVTILSIDKENIEGNEIIAKREPIKSGDLTYFIPTWPDYIELEKDLWIQKPETYYFGEGKSTKAIKTYILSLIHI